MSLRDRLRKLKKDDKKKDEENKKEENAPKVEEV